MNEWQHKRGYIFNKSAVDQVVSVFSYSRFSADEFEDNQLPYGCYIASYSLYIKF